LKLFQEWGEERIKENDGVVNSSMMYLIYCKNLCKCHDVPPPSTTIKLLKNTNKMHLLFGAKNSTFIYSS
jgi:hypothetical protein